MLPMAAALLRLNTAEMAAAPLRLNAAEMAAAPLRLNAADGRALLVMSLSRSAVTLTALIIRDH